MYRNLTKNNPKTVACTLASIGVLMFVFVLSVQTTSAQVPPAAPSAGSDLNTRIAQRKAERNVVISEQDQTRLVNSCMGAQTKLRSLQSKTTPVVAKRVEVDQQVDGKLWVMIGKLKIAKRDTFEFEKQRATLAGRVATQQQTSKNYEQTIDDAITINCKADIVGFKSLIDTARIYRTQVRDQTNAVRDYINNDIKKTLSGFATDLQAKPSTEEGR